MDSKIDTDGFCFESGAIPLITHEVPSMITPAMREKKKCAACGNYYTDEANIGALECARHIYPVNHTTQTYPCCNALGPGCVRCDHRESITEPYPGCSAPVEVCGGVAAMKVCYGNLKELRNCKSSAIIYPPGFERLDERQRQREPVYVLRWLSAKW